MSYNLGFIGGGNMSTAIVRGILKNGSHEPSKIWVSGPHLENLKHWKDMGTNITNKNIEVFENCEMVFLGVKPIFLEKAINDCAGLSIESSKPITVVSMLAGVKIVKLKKELAKISPIENFKVIRIMPNTPMTVGAGACLYTPDDCVDKEVCKKLESLLSTSSICEKVSEYIMDTLGVLTGCGPAFIYIIIEALADGAVKQGVPRAMALRFAAQTVSGSAQMVLQTSKHPGLLKDEVCSPGGSTICGVSALENGNLRATLIQAIEAATMKTISMSHSQS